MDVEAEVAAPLRDHRDPTPTPPPPGTTVGGGFDVAGVPRLQQLGSGRAFLHPCEAAATRWAPYPGSTGAIALSRSSSTAHGKSSRMVTRGHGAHRTFGCAATALTRKHCAFASDPDGDGGPSFRQPPPYSAIFAGCWSSATLRRRTVCFKARICVASA